MEEIKTRLKPSTILHLIMLVFNAISIGWFALMFYGWAVYPNMTYIFIEPDKITATVEFAVAVLVLILDLIEIAGFIWKLLK
jgi:hypothetical protein